MKFLDEETKGIIIEALLINAAVQAIGGLAMLFATAMENIDSNHSSKEKTPMAITQKLECENQPTIR